MKYFARITSKEYELQVDNEGSGYSVTVGQNIQYVDFQQIDGSDLFSMIVNGRSYTYNISKNSNGYIIRNRGKNIEVTVQNERDHYLSKLVNPVPKTEGEESIKAIMPGLVVRVEVKVGDPILKGQGLIILQAMKMENEIKSSLAGIVTEIFVQDKQTVEKGQILLSIQSVLTK
jgi:biotin carboxyl carrier protein